MTNFKLRSPMIDDDDREIDREMDRAMDTLKKQIKKRTE